jgi:hypothetical protein
MRQTVILGHATLRKRSAHNKLTTFVNDKMPPSSKKSNGLTDAILNDVVTQIDVEAVC